jgi:hypothetical protein
MKRIMLEFSMNASDGRHKALGLFMLFLPEKDELVSYEKSRSPKRYSTRPTGEPAELTGKAGSCISWDY